MCSEYGGHVRYVAMAVSQYKTREQKRNFYDSLDWKAMREAVKKRDNYECMECRRNGYVTVDRNEYSESAGRKKIALVVDHIQELEDYPGLALDDENLETLCVRCHNKKHDRFFGTRKNTKWDGDERW